MKLMKVFPKMRDFVTINNLQSYWTVILSGIYKVNHKRNKETLNEELTCLNAQLLSGDNSHDLKITASAVQQRFLHVWGKKTCMALKFLSSSFTVKMIS